MSYSRRGRYDSVSPRRDRYESYSPRRHREDSYSPRRYRYDSYYSRRERSISRSYSRSRSRSRSRESDDVSNPGNNLYVTGLSPRITKRDLEEHFSKEGTVVECHLVVDPRTRESRGFGFVTMATIEDADRCIKYLDRSVLEGRVITVEKARRKRGRTPTPGKYLGAKPTRVRDFDRRYSSDRYSSRRSPSYSPYRGRYGSPRYSPYDRRYRYRSRSPYYYRDRSYSPYGRDRSYSPYGRDRSYSPYRRDRSYSPYRRDRSYSPYRRERSYSSYSRRYRSPSPYRRRDRSISPYYRRGRRSDRSVSPY